MARLVYGVGVNDSPTPIQRYGISAGKRVVEWRCPFYTRWANMLKRCFAESSLKSRPGYSTVDVCDEWKYFSNFKAWMEKQDWEGKHLDKDLLGSGDIYSPENCVFIDSDVNSYIKSSTNKFGLPTGITHYPSGSWYASILRDRSRIYLGKFKTEQEAVNAYLTAKIDIACELFSDRPPQILSAIIRRFDEGRVL